MVNVLFRYRIFKTERKTNGIKNIKSRILDFEFNTKEKNL